MEILVAGGTKKKSIVYIVQVQVQGERFQFELETNLVIASSHDVKELLRQMQDGCAAELNKLEYRKHPISSEAVEVLEWNIVEQPAESGKKSP